MDQDLKAKVERRLKMFGMTKSYLAAQMKISTAQLSQTFSGTRKMKTEELTLLKSTLKL